jgi:hypothetical protein
MNPFQTIADRLVAACPPPFTKAWITAKVDDDHTSMQYWCEPAGVVEQPEVAPQAAFEIGDALIELKQRPPYNATEWAECRFAVSSSGQFDFTVEYLD